MLRLNMGAKNEARAFIGLGSNAGDRLATLRSAVRSIEASEHCRVAKTSPIFETRPLGPSNEPYLNAAIMVYCDVDAPELLSFLHEVEHDHGRVRSERWGARTLDLDLLLYAEAGSHQTTQSNTPALQLPHPRLLQRDFVLEPLLHLAPNLRLNGTAASVHLGRLRNADRCVLRRLDAPLREVDLQPQGATFAQL